MKSIRSTAAAAALVLVLGGCGNSDDAATPASPSPTTTASARSLAILTPTSGSTVKGNVVSLDLEAKGVSIVKADGDTSGRTGHYHLFIDREPVAAGAPIPKEAGIVHSTDDPVVLTGMAVGTHRIVVVYGDGAHVRMGATQTETTVKIEGPSLKATAPASTPADQPVVLDVKVEGLNLVKADGDTSGRTGHLHVFVDREPTPAGQPIPVEPGIIHSVETRIEVAGLAPGEHTLWVVAGDGTHSPLNPRVMDKVTVNVA
ncbi:MAG: DUF4399 domain-containing protein [Acidimicrobiales bacterium]